MRHDLPQSPAHTCGVMAKLVDALLWLNPLTPIVGEGMAPWLQSSRCCRRGGVRAGSALQGGVALT